MENVDGSGSESCPGTSFCFNGVELSDTCAISLSVILC